MSRTRLALAPGSGRLLRRGDAVLFLPAPDETVLSAFTGADHGGELQALASATVAAGFGVGTFAALSWRDGPVRVMVFGDVAVETDQPTLPMLSGAGSRTWVEHSMTLDGSAVVAVGDPEAVVDDTQLDEGLVVAGGFRLTLDPRLELRGEPEPPADDTEAASGRDPTTSVARPGPEPTPEPGRPTAPTSPDAPAPAPIAPALSAPAPIDPADPEAALAAIQAAAMTEDGTPVAALGDVTAFTPPTVPAVPVDDPSLPPPGDDPDVTLAPPDVQAMRAELTDARASLVDAKVCSRAHPNPPAAASCAVCAELLAPGPSAVVHVPQPVLGALELDDGTRLPLDADLLLGRNPGRQVGPDHAEHRPVTVPGDKVSRRHLEVRRHGWDVVVSDLGSTNGAFVVPHPGGPVLALEPGRPQLIEPGATVYFGSRSFTVLGRGPS